jgi:hypothetical protein
MSINLTPLTADLNAHQNLPEKPSVTSQELKILWDKPVNDIKDYLNNLTGQELPTKLATELTEWLNTAKGYTDTQVSGISQAAEDITFDNSGTGLQAANVQDAIEEVKTGANGLSGRISALESGTSQATYSVSPGSGASISKQTIAKIGNIVFIQMEGTIDIPAGGQSGSICSLPQAIRPSGTRYLQSYVTDGGRNCGTDAVVVVGSDGSIKVNSPYAAGYYGSRRFQIHGFYIK